MDYERPLTTLMLRQMLEVRSLELSENEEDVGLLDHFKGTLAGLFRRGLVNTKKVTVKGKELTGVYITENGVSFLNDFVANFLPDADQGAGEEESCNSGELS